MSIFKRKSLTYSPLELDLSHLFQFEGRYLIQNIDKSNFSREQLASEDAYRAELARRIQEALEHIELNYSVRRIGDRLFFDKPVEHAIELSDRSTLALMRDEGSLLELKYSGSPDYLLKLKSLHEWGFKAYTQKGVRAFNWSKVEALCFSVQGDRLKFYPYYYVVPKGRTFEVTWALAEQDHWRLKKGFA